MIKGKLIELIQERLNNGSTTPDIWKQAHPLVIAEYAGLAINNIMYQIFSRSVDGYDIYGKWYYNVPVENSQSDIPCSKVQLPDNSYSIRKITLTGESASVRFLPVKPLASSVLTRLGSVDRMNIIPYEVVDNKVLYTNIGDITKVNMYAITNFSDLNNDDDFPIPAGQGEAVINGIMNYFRDARPKDNELNND